MARDQSGYNFDFRLLYKVLPREMAVVRFGGIRNEGKLVACYSENGSVEWNVNQTVSLLKSNKYLKFKLRERLKLKWMKNDEKDWISG